MSEKDFEHVTAIPVHPQMDADLRAQPKPKRKQVRRKLAAAAPAKAPSEFTGLTAGDCCDGCSPEKCVISATNVCAHPFKGGLQSALMQRPDVMKRHRAARKFLALAKIELTET